MKSVLRPLIFLLLTVYGFTCYAQPEINVKGNSIDIFDGDATPDISNHTDFSYQSVCSGTVVRTFTIQNTGNANLNIMGITITGAHAADFAITSPAAGTVAASSSTTVQLTFNPSAPGGRNAVVTVTTNDADEATYDFAITGTGIDPEINLQGNGITINDGDATPSLADHTDFGSQLACNGIVVRAFSIQNSGNSNLTISSITITGAHGADYAIATAPTATVTPGGNTTFQVTFNPSAVGARNAVINVNTNDCDEAQYNFAITGTGTAVTGNTITASACGSYQYNGRTYALSGTYTDTLTSSTGCDSIVTLNLAITNPEVQTSIIAAGFGHTVSVCADSTVRAWGDGLFGKMGNGSNGHSNLPVTVSNLTGVVAVASTADHILALRSNGTVWAWGNNGLGQLGNGSTTDSNIPVLVNGLNNIAAIATGGYHSLALGNNGTVWAWGRNNFGQLGNGSNINSLVPVQISGLINVVAIAAGEDYSLALLTDGSVWAWGRNMWGQLGNGSNADSNTPIQVSGISSVVAIAAITTHTIALKSNGTVWAWGLNNVGQLGNGSTTNSNIPVQVIGLTNIGAIATGYNHNVALQHGGNVWAWGRNDEGQFGNGNYASSTVPVPVGGISAVVAVKAGMNHTIIQYTNGTIATFGGNAIGQLGNGISGINTQSNIPVTPTGLCTAAVNFSSGVLILQRSTLTTTACGSYTSPAGNVYTATGTYTDTLTSPEGCDSIVTINLTISQAVTSTITASACGSYNYNGRTYVLSGTYTDTLTTTGGCDSIVTLNLTITNRALLAQTVALGEKHILALYTNGAIMANGENDNGEFGNGNTVSSTIPVSGNNLTGVVSMSASTRKSLALRNDSTVWAWGANITIPTQVTGVNSIVSIAQGYSFSLALRADGTVWAWGNNVYGQLGNGNNTTSNTPVQVTGLTNVVGIAAGRDFALALRNDGTVWAWGQGANGKLGNGSTANANQPQQVSNLSGVVSIAAGGQHSLALGNDGRVWAWGWNIAGQIGNGTTTNANTPVLVSGLSNVVSIACGYIHSLALQSNGTVRSWGDNLYGSLGNGTNTDSNIPVVVSNLTGIVFITSGNSSSHSAAILQNGNLFTWGFDDQGQLGNGGANANSNVPVQPAGLPKAAVNLSYDNTVLVLQRSSITTTACGSYTSPAGNIYTATGTYTDTLTTTTGCDSLVTVQLTISNGSTAAISQTVCHNTPYNFNGNTLTTAGTYVDTLTTTGGCDSIITLTLAVLPEEPGSQLFESVCFGASYNFNGRLVDTTGIYTDTLYNITGCDSVITLELFVSQPTNTNVTVMGDTLLAPAGSDDFYQWINCADMEPIPNANSREFVPDTTGEYAVIRVPLNGCADTSACIPVSITTGIGIAQGAPAQIGVKVFPNPANAAFGITVTGLTVNAQLKIYNMFGQTVFTQTGVSNAQYNINSAGWQSGVYMLELTAGNNTTTRRVVVNN